MKLVESLIEHIDKKAEPHADRLMVPDFPRGKDWFNSPPLSFQRELRGKVVVLDFWTYCCINCLHVLPDLDALERKYEGYPVAFVGVHSAKFDNERISENVRRAVLRYGIRHPVINDDEMALWRALGVRAWPTLAVVGPRGNLILVTSGEGQKDLLDAAITAALRYYPPEAFRHDPLPLLPEAGREPRASPLRFPGKVAVSPERGSLFISDTGHNRIVVTDLEGRFKYAIGNGRAGLEDGAFEKAAFRMPQGIAAVAGRLYIADTENHALRVADLERREVRTLAGDGVQGRDYQGGGKGPAQRLSSPWDLAFHGGKLYIAMAGTHQIWVFDPKDGSVRAFSGTGAERNENHGDPRLAAWAQPSGLAVGPGELYVADSESSSVRAISLTGGGTRTIAGGDDTNPRDLFAFGDREGRGDEARFQHPLAVAWIERLGRIAVADTYNHRLKLVDPHTREVRFWVGSGRPGLQDGRGLEARFSEPGGLAFDAARGRLFVADTNNHAVRAVDLETLEVRTLKLEGVPAPLPAESPRSERLADLPGAATVRADPLRVRPGGRGTFILRLRPPRGHRFLEGDGGRWQVLDEGGGPLAFEEDRARGRIGGGGDVEIPFTVPAGFNGGAVRIEALGYFCGDNGTCKPGAVTFEVPVTADAEAPETARRVLEYTFEDLSGKFRP